MFPSRTIRSIVSVELAEGDTQWKCQLRYRFCSLNSDHAGKALTTDFSEVSSCLVILRMHMPSSQTAL